MRFISRFFRDGRLRRRRVFGIAVAAVVAAMAFSISAAFGILSGSPSNFESGDGNMVVDTTGNHDWANVSFDHVTDLASSQNDDSFVSGQKQDAACPDVYQHGNPPKDDFTDVASYSETQTSSPRHTFLYGATIRFAPNGNASENVELKQGKNGTCSNGLLARTVGDKLVAIDYLSGGTNVDFHVLTWIDGTDSNNPTCFVSNDVPPCWGALVQHPTSVEGKASQSDISAANNPISGAALKAGQFAEFGVDLSAPDVNIIPAGTCKAFPQTIWESRSSGSSFVSTTKDISIENHTISNCGEIKIIKQTNPRGIDQKFSFTSGSATTNKLLADTTAGGVPCVTGGDAGVDSNGSFCLNDKNNGGKTLGSATSANNDTANTVDEKSLSPGTYSLTEGSDPSGFTFDSVSCTVNNTPTTLNTVANPKTVTVNLKVNDVVVCIYQNNQQLGAIQISKTSTKGGAALSGAHFRICTNDGPYTTLNPCSPAKTGSGDVATGSDGTYCLDGLAFGDYYVSEKSPPNGYAADDTSAHKVTVDNNAKCSDATYVGESIPFTDTPLSTIEVKFTSLAGSGVTTSQIVCKKGTTVVGANTENGSADNETTPVRDDTDEVFGDGTSTLTPGVYTCTIDIDP